MNTVLWVLQWTVAAMLVVSFLAIPFAARATRYPRPGLVVLMSCVGLACAVGLIVPWWTGHARILTPLAALVVLATTVFDALTNRMPGADRVYLVALMLMAVVIAAGRLLELR